VLTVLTFEEIKQILKESPLAVLLSPKELEAETIRIKSILDGTVNNLEEFDEEVNHAC
jgi:hypothetical protein